MKTLAMTCCGVVLASALLLRSAAAETFSPPERSEVIDEVARFTGLTQEGIGLALGDSPELFDGLEDAVFGVRVVNQFCEAKDGEALADLVDYAFGKAINALKDKVLPQSVNVFLTALSVYHASLEVIRDYVFIPKFDEKIYQEYKSARLDDLRRGDSSVEAQNTAFSRATTQKDSGYFVVKDHLFDQMMKAKGYNAHQLGERVLGELRKKIDAFWMGRLELKLQQEVLKNRREELVSDIWNSCSGQLEALRALTARASGPERFFIVESDIPAGWKLDRRDAKLLERFKPVPRSGGDTAQAFTLRPTGYNEKNGNYYDRTGKKTLRFMHDHIDVAIAPVVRTLAGGYVFNFKDQMAEGLKKNESYLRSSAKIVRPLTEHGIELGYVAIENQADFRRGDDYVAAFVKKGWYVTIGINGFSLKDLEALDNDEASRESSRAGSTILKTVASEDFLMQLVKIIAEKIP